MSWGSVGLPLFQTRALRYRAMWLTDRRVSAPVLVVAAFGIASFPSFPVAERETEHPEVFQCFDRTGEPPRQQHSVNKADAVARDTQCGERIPIRLLEAIRLARKRRGRDTAFAVPPAQIRTGGFPASGSCLR